MVMMPVSHPAEYTCNYPKACHGDRNAIQESLTVMPLPDGLGSTPSIQWNRTYQPETTPPLQSHWRVHKGWELPATGIQNFDGDR